MKKIFLMLVAVCAFAACDPIHEKIGNAGHISLEELKAMTTVTVDKANSGLNGNVITCQTSAPVNAKWDFAGKELIGNYASKKMKLGDHVVTLTALCPDGTLLTAEYPISCQEITNPLEKIYIFGPAEEGQEAVLGPGDAAAGRFSDSEGKFFPYLSDDVYYGLKTLIFDITDAQDGDHIWGAGYGPAQVRVMTGWWDPVFADGVELKAGLWELPITQEMAEWCAHSNKEKDGKARNRDLDLLMTRGSVTIKSVYYEE